MGIGLCSALVILWGIQAQLCERAGDWREPRLEAVCSMWLPKLAEVVAVADVLGVRVSVLLPGSRRRTKPAFYVREMPSVCFLMLRLSALDAIR